MPGIPFGQGLVHVACCTDPVPEFAEMCVGIFQGEFHGVAFVFEKVGDVGFDGIDVVPGQEFGGGLFLPFVQQYPFAVGLHDAEVGAAGEAGGNVIAVAGEVDVVRIVAVGGVEAAEYPGEAIVGFDVIGRIGETIRAEQVDAGFVTGGVVGDVAASFDEGGRPAAAGVEDEDVHGDCIPSPWPSP